MTGDSRSQPSTASAKCRHDVSEDCPACMAAEIATLTSSLAAADARGKELERELAEWKQAASVEAGLRREFHARGKRLEEALEDARTEIVLAIAFVGRDRGTDRFNNTIEELLRRFVAADAKARAALSQTEGRMEDYDSEKLRATGERLLRAAKPERERVIEAATLARRLCQIFDSGGESQRTVRARYASAIFQLLHDESPPHEVEQAKCDADPIQYLKDAEDRALKGTPA